jgi:predicted MPP superfamily phosphohydrolase
MLSSTNSRAPDVVFSHFVSANDIERVLEKQKNLNMNIKSGHGHLRILHLSDLHARAKTAVFQNKVVEAAKRHIERINTDDSYEKLIVFSGDIAYSGKPNEYELAKEWIESIREAFGATEEQIVVAPGNHDVDRTLLSPHEIRGFRTLNTQELIEEFFSGVKEKHT